jgi:hypothetical protein
MAIERRAFGIVSEVGVKKNDMDHKGGLNF